MNEIISFLIGFAFYPFFKRFIYPELKPYVKRKIQEYWPPNKETEAE